MNPDFRDEEGFDWQKTITRLREYNNDILVALWVGPDGKDSDDYIVQVLFHLSQKPNNDLSQKPNISLVQRTKHFISSSKFLRFYGQMTKLLEMLIDSQ
jgi:hypothetical protein